MCDLSSFWIPFSRLNTSIYIKPRPAIKSPYFSSGSLDYKHAQWSVWFSVLPSIEYIFSHQTLYAIYPGLFIALFIWLFFNISRLTR